MGGHNRGQWGNGAQNPSRIRAMEGTDDTGERARQCREMDARFAAAMLSAPEGRPLGVCKAAGNERSRKIRPPVTSIIRSSSGW